MGLDWEAQGVLADFRECQRTSQNTDLLFHCTNGNVSAHQMIFAGISPFFTDLMQRFVIGQDLFPLDLNISLPEIRREHVEMVVEIVYTGQVRITKRDYQPFREICQLLQLSVPIADYDNFFMNKGRNADKSNSFDALEGQEQVSIPLKSPTVPRVFVCDECYAMFPLKIGLKRHKKSQHEKIESEAPNPQQSPTMTEPSTVEPQLNARLTRQRSLNGSKNLVCLQNDECMVECPDCKSLFGPRQVRQHLAVHLREELDALVMRNKSVSGLFKCQETPCSYETSVPFHMVRHLGATHDFITKFANEAQIKFLHDAEELIRRPRSSSLKTPCNSSPEKNEKTINQLGTRQHSLENEDDPENENNDIEPEIGSAREDSSESESQSFNELDEVNRSMFAPLDQPSSSSLNVTIPKSTQIAERAIKCPDCQSLIHPSQVKYHLIRHLRKELNEFFKKSESKPEVFECQLCSQKTSVRSHIQSHVGVTHDMLPKVANAAQKKFLQDGQGMINKPWKKKKVYLRTRNPTNLTNSTTKNEDFLENGEKNVEIEESNSVQDATNNVSMPKNGDCMLECPDCQSLKHPSQVKYHMINHLRKELDDFLKKSESKPEVFECQSCSFKTPFGPSLRRHVAVQHDMLFKFTNAAQKKFIQDGQDIISNPYRKKELFILRTRNRIQKKEDSLQVGDNGEIQGNNGVQDATNSESPAKKDERALECPDCRRFIHPRKFRQHLIGAHLREKLSKHSTKSESVCGLYRCQFCSYETTAILTMNYHVGMKHKMMIKYANATQKKFIEDAQRMFFKVRNSEKPNKTGQRITCPTCLKNYLPQLARKHLITHLQEQLNEHLTMSETMPQVFKCKLCPFEASIPNKVRHHLALSHKMISTYADPAQKKFLQDARKLPPVDNFPKPTSHCPRGKRRRSRN